MSAEKHIDSISLEALEKVSGGVRFPILANRFPNWSAHRQARIAARLAPPPSGG